MRKLNKAFLLLGSNLGDRFQNLEKAHRKIEEKTGQIVHFSAIYETEAWGKKDQPSFLNQVVLIETSLHPLALLKKIHLAEAEIGRIRYDKWGERIIDIDILFYNDVVIDTEELKIPHPLMQFRKFALIPLLDISNGLVHPVFHVGIDTLLQQCPDELKIKLIKTELIK